MAYYRVCRSFPFYFSIVGWRSDGTNILQSATDWEKSGGFLLSEK